MGVLTFKLSGSEFWKNGDELTIIKEWFQYACESKPSKSEIGPCGELRGLFAICDIVGEEKWELSRSNIEVSEIKLMSCGVSITFETVWIGCGNSELWVLFVFAKFIGCLENRRVFELLSNLGCGARDGGGIIVGGWRVVYVRKPE